MDGFQEIKFVCAELSMELNGPVDVVTPVKGPVPIAHTPMNQPIVDTADDKMPDVQKKYNRTEAFTRNLVDEFRSWMYKNKGTK